MHAAGVVLIIFGGVLTFASALALSCHRDDDGIRGMEPLDLFLLGGVFTFLRDLCGAIAMGLRDWRSPAFPLVIVLGSGAGLLAAGCLLLWLAGAR